MMLECGTLLGLEKETLDEWTSGWPEYILFVVNFVFTMVGIFANSFGLLFFIKKQRKDITTILFIALCIVDLTTVLTLGPLQMLINVQAVNFFNFSTQHFTVFSVFSALSNLEIRFSMFLFMVMSWCRCLSVVSPFRRNNKKLVFSALLCYLVPLFVLCFYPVFVCSDMSYTIVPFTRIGQSEFISTLESSEIETRHWAYLVVMEIVTMYIPVIPITITSYITAHNLIFSPAMKSTNAKSSRDGAITILILTVSTLICFTPRLAISLSALKGVADHTIADRIIDSVGERWACFVLYLLTSGLSIANSGINPCIFLARGQNMKTYFKKSMHGAYRKSSAALTRGHTSMSLMSSVLANKSVAREETTFSNTFNKQDTVIALSPMRNTTSPDLNGTPRLQPKINDSSL